MSLFNSRLLALGLAAFWLLPMTYALRYNETLDPWNINKNKGERTSKTSDQRLTGLDATMISEYTTERANRTYTASPTNWRVSDIPFPTMCRYLINLFQELPCYTLLLDKWMDGDPSNDDFFKTMYEYDHREVNLRNGGDAEGLINARGLDYLQGMGVRSIYIAGTYFLNMPWQADGLSHSYHVDAVADLFLGYSAIDFTLLDPHYGTLAHWAELIDEMHRRGMYIILDFTVGTMGDFIGFKEYVLSRSHFPTLTRYSHLNVSTPFNIDEYEAQWKRPTYAPWGFDYYPDFNFTNGEDIQWTARGASLLISLVQCTMTHASCLLSGSMTEASLTLERLVATQASLTSMVISRLSVFCRYFMCGRLADKSLAPTGNVSWLSLPPCRIVCENGARWPRKSLRSLDACRLKPLTLTAFVSIKPPRSLWDSWRIGLRTLESVPRISVKTISSFRVRSLVAILLVPFTCACFA
jgi:hypothetical protein